MKKFNICKDSTICLQGRHLPKGAMYGQDSKGLWICLSYKSRNIFDMGRKELAKLAGQAGIDLEAVENYTSLTRGTLLKLLKQEPAFFVYPKYAKMRDETGMYRRVMIRPAEARPFLVLLRPKKRDLVTGTGYENRTKWVACLEYGETVDKILELVERYPKRCEIKRAENEHYKVVPEIEKGRIMIRKRATVSNREASRAAGNPDGRGIKEFIPHAVMHGLTKSKPKEYAILTGNYVDLEKLAAKQREEVAKKPARPYKKSETLINIYPERTSR